MGAWALAACGGSQMATPPSAGQTSGVSTDVVTPPLGVQSEGVRPEGFESVTLRIFADGDGGAPAHELCVWEAATAAQRTRGLMGVTDLAGRQGMIFVYAEKRSTSFTMRNTLMPLSIAFFDAEGLYLDAFDMEPCGAEPCPTYPTPDGFRVALEVPVGELALWGVGPGVRAQRGIGCDTPSS